MEVVRVSDARSHFSEIIDKAAHEPVILERYGERAAIIISPAQYDRMLDALEEIEDVEAFDAAMAESGATIPWEQVRADLGWG